jgi:multisubunit Na+/H+ antiporter MnhB subunit
VSRSAPSGRACAASSGRVPSILADARPGAVQTGQVSELEPGPSRTEAVLLAAIYVVPLTLSIAFLAYVGLPGLALALLAVEAMVSAMVVLAKRPEGSRLSRLAVALAVLAVAAGVGAVALLIQPAPGG